MLFDCYVLDYMFCWYCSGELFYILEGMLCQVVCEVLGVFVGVLLEESIGGGIFDVCFIVLLGVQCIEVGLVNVSIYQVDENVVVVDLEWLLVLYQCFIECLLV